MRCKVANNQLDTGITEHEEQKMLIKWWSMSCTKFGIPEVCLFAIPNAAKRSMKIASMLKAEGMRSGIPDLFLAVPRCGKHGLFIEMKKTKCVQIYVGLNDSVTHEQKVYFVEERI